MPSDLPRQNLRIHRRNPASREEEPTRESENLPDGSLGQGSAFQKPAAASADHDSSTGSAHGKSILFRPGLPIQSLDLRYTHPLRQPSNHALTPPRVPSHRAKTPTPRPPPPPGVSVRPRRKIHPPHPPLRIRDRRAPARLDKPRDRRRGPSQSGLPVRQGRATRGAVRCAGRGD